MILYCTVVIKNIFLNFFVVFTQHCRAKLRADKPSVICCSTEISDLMELTDITELTEITELTDITELTEIKELTDLTELTDIKEHK